MFEGPSPSINFPDQHSVEAASVSIDDKAIQGGA
jgi:hypothetical protein